MNKLEIQKQMRELVDQYNKLKEQLDIVTHVERKEKFQKDQAKILETFKAKYTVTAPFNGTPEAINWAEVEAQVLSESNVDSMVLKGEGHGIGYDNNGDPYFGTSYSGGGAGINYAIDAEDAARHKERETRRREHERKVKERR